MHALSHRNDEPPRASRPFEAHRDGFVSGEGAGILVLEDLELARTRGAYVYAEVLGYASTSDAHHITEPAPGGAGLARALRRALTKAQLRPEQVEYINAHGTSTKYNDRDESAAIRSVFGEHASRLAGSSTKSMTGHLMGAAGGVANGVEALPRRARPPPPTLNHDPPDPQSAPDYTRHQ